MKYKLSNEIKQQEYLKACELSRKGFTKKEIIDNTLFPTWRVLEFYMNRNNLKLPFTNFLKTHQSDNNFFEKLDSFKNAYLLGVTYADGCIYNNHRFGFCLSKQDESLIDYIKDNICPTALKKEIVNKKGALNRQSQIQLRITNHRIVNTLKSVWGVKERKTLNSGLVFPNVEKKFIWNFILGLNDGDGNVYFKQKTSKGYPTIRITICLTDLPFLLKLKQFLIEENINVSLYTKQGKTCKYYLLQTTNNLSAVKFCENIYKDAEFFLERKYNKYHEFISMVNTVLNIESNKSISV
jgi:hypothetical protein